MQPSGHLRSAGKYGEAKCYLDDAFEISQRINDEGALAMVLQFIGLLAEVREQDKDAERLYQQSLARIRQIGHLPSIAIALEQLATVARKQGQYERALALYKEKLAIDKEANDMAGMASRYTS